MKEEINGIDDEEAPDTFKVVTIDLETADYTVVLNRSDAHILGLRALDRVKVSRDDNSITALVELTDSVVGAGSIGVLKRGGGILKVKGGEEVRMVPAQRPRSIEIIKKRMKGLELDSEEILMLTEDITNHLLSDVELAAFVTATYINPMNNREIRDLTMSIVKTGEVIDIDGEPIYDFHSIGGAPGNKITLIVVPIVAAAGLLIPKTCSRAISSAGGTADILETIANVTLPSWSIKNITETVGGGIAWGGGVNIAPADDIIIRAEYPLAIDPYSQVIASVLAKKKAVGADYLLIDIPTGENTKVPDMNLARKYARDFIEIGDAIGIHVECAITYGGQPIGRGIGPALEMKEVLLVLEGDIPSSSVVEKALSIAGIILEMGGTHEDGKRKAEEILKSGKALVKFKEIIRAQGCDLEEIGSGVVRESRYVDEVRASKDGYIASINNRSIVKICRAAGCPHEKYGGIYLHKKKGDKVRKGDLLYTVHSDHKRKLQTALRASQKLDPIYIEGMVIERVPRDAHHII